MNSDKLHPLRTGDGKWHSAASHESEPAEFKKRMDEYRRRVREEARYEATVTPIAKRKGNAL